MAKGLKGLVGSDLVFIDEENEKTNGSLMYLENFFDPRAPSREHFFVPYDGTHPFKISFVGQETCLLSKNRKKIYGSSENY